MREDLKDYSGEPLVLLTGGAGFIGGYVVEEFAAAGWHVLALIHRRTSERLRGLAAAGQVTLLPGDAADPHLAETAVVPALAGRPLQAVVHCAGRASDVGRRHQFHHATLASTEALTALCGRLAVPRFTFVSTTDVYGLRDFAGEAEDALPLVNNTGNSYPEYKIRAEQHLRATLPPERYAVVRPAAVWGSGDTTLSPRVVAFLRSSPWIIHFGRRWRGANRWPLAHVRNVAAAVYLATVLSEGAAGAINVLDDEWTSVEQWYRLLAEVYLPGKRLRSLTLPAGLVWPWAALVEAVSGALALDHPFSDPSLYALRTVSSNLDFGNARLRALLAAGGRRLVTREEGLEELRREEAGRQVRSAGHPPALRGT